MNLRNLKFEPIIMKTECTNNIYSEGDAYYSHVTISHTSVTVVSVTNLAKGNRMIFTNNYLLPVLTAAC